MTQLNDYNVEMELQAWLKDERHHLEKRFELREKVFKALTAAGVEMPFETIQVLQKPNPSNVNQKLDSE